MTITQLYLHQERLATKIKWIMSTLERAIEIARQAHVGQVDKGGADYIGHPLRVMEMGRTEDEKIVGVLHDVVEDSDWTFEMLEEEGFAPEIIEALRCLTKLSKDEDYEHFMARVKSNKMAIKVKLCDLTDNLDSSRLANVTEEDIKRSRKYARAYSFLKRAISLL